MSKDAQTRKTIETMLEDEALVDGLTDAAARLLLEWAVQQAKEIVRQTKGSPKERNARLKALRRRVRQIAREAGRASPHAQRERVEALLELGTLLAQSMATSAEPGRSRRLSLGIVLFVALLLVGLGIQQCTGGELLGRRAVHETVAEPWIQVYFTAPAGDHGTGHEGIDSLVELIDQATTQVDVAAYDLDLEPVAEAMIRAHERGVRVRLVTDGSNADEPVVQQLRLSGIPVVARPEEDRGLMHDKFVVVDGFRVWTGSWNLTENGTYRNDNNAVLIDSHYLAEDYAAEFEEMFSGMFGPTSPARTPYPVIEIAGGTTSTRVEAYFAPEDGVTERILHLLSGADSHVRFLAYHFTSEPLAEALIDLVARGIQVEGVIEGRTVEGAYSQFDRLQVGGVEVLPDGNPYLMHHKVMIVDDEAILLGSFNFTQSAEEENDENALVVYNPEVAAAYTAEFARVQEVARTAER